MVRFLRGNSLNMKPKKYILKQEGCDDCVISTSNAIIAYRIEEIKDALRDVDLESEKLVMLNQKQFGDEWEAIDKARDLLRQLLNEITLEGI